MSDTRCSECGATMDQSELCSHVCPPDPIRERLDILDSQVAALRAQMQSLQMAAPRGIPKEETPMPGKAWGCGNGPGAYCMAVGEPCSDHPGLFTKPTARGSGTDAATEIAHLKADLKEAEAHHVEHHERENARGVAAIVAYVRSYESVREDGTTIYGPYQDAADMIADGIEARFGAAPFTSQAPEKKT